jgi:signal transduction histidine kinase
MATIVDGVSADAPAVTLQLQPYFYQRRVFIPLCILLAASIAYFIYWRRVHFIRANAQAVLNERSRIARELHDTLMQGFAGVTMELQALASRLPTDSDRRTELNEIIRDAGVCLREARQSVAGLRTNVRLDTSTLATALTQAARQVTQGKPVRLRLSLRPPANQLPPEVEYNLLRIAQEALTNAVKHSGCRTIDLTLSTTPDTLNLTVADDGSGITAPASPGHFGLVGMKERAAQIRATLDIESQAGSGTTVRVALPLAASNRHPLSEPARTVPEQLPT